jgi:hypothetical protein
MARLDIRKLSNSIKKKSESKNLYDVTTEKVEHIQIKTFKDNDDQEVKRLFIQLKGFDEPKWSYLEALNLDTPPVITSGTLPAKVSWKLTFIDPDELDEFDEDERIELDGNFYRPPVITSIAMDSMEDYLEKRRAALQNLFDED